MAWRIDKEIVHGWVDNTEPGKVTGKIFLEGWDEPMHLELEGNCYRDLAGSRCEFKNPSPLLNRRLDINPEQIGKVGDMTASRRCKVPDIISPLDLIEQKEKDLNPPVHWSNVLYLEWFSESNGRVVIELPDAEIDVTLPKWKMSRDEEKEQMQNNAQNMTSFLDKLVEAKLPVRKPKMDEEEVDEFEWELFMKESDAKSEKYGELLEKYIDHPDRDKIINEQMGWNFDESKIVEGWSEKLEVEEEVYPDDIFDREKHPLVKRMGDLWFTIHEYVDGYPLDHADDEATGILVADLIFNIQCASAKSSSVLSYADFENGMIIAKLKRAITYIHEAINIAGNEKVGRALKDIIEPTQAELFVIREKMIKIMDKLRKS